MFKQSLVFPLFSTSFKVAVINSCHKLDGEDSNGGEEAVEGSGFAGDGVHQVLFPFPAASGIASEGREGGPPQVPAWGG